MKKQAKQDQKAVQTLMQSAMHDIIAAARIANGGQPAGKDVAELMAAWGTIAKVVSHPRAPAHKTFCTAQLAMFDGLMGEAA